VIASFANAVGALVLWRCLLGVRFSAAALLCVCLVCVVCFDSNRYHLRIVPHSDIDESYFFTISASGVTLYDNGVAEFSALTQWHR
jgi:hypothetical protein